MNPAAGYVLDASVAAKWFTHHEEENLDRALALRALHVDGLCRLIAPEIMFLEVVNAVRYSGRAEAIDSILAIEGLERLHLETVPIDWTLLRKASSCSWSYDLAVYDALYVVIAEREGVPLLTADEALFKKMRGHRLVVRLADAHF